MSRTFQVTKKRGVVYRQSLTPAGAALDTRVHPMNPEKGAEDVGYEGMPRLELPQAGDRTISNRSGERKKI